jgi:hypothetical protein
LGIFAEAETAGYEGMIQHHAATAAVGRAALDATAEWIAKLYDDWGKPDKSPEWRSKVQQR